VDKETYFGRGPSIPHPVKEIVAEIYTKAQEEDPGITAKEVMDKVHKFLHQYGKQLRPGWPGLSAVQKILAKIRRNESAVPPDPEDSPWSILDIAKYPIPPEVLPVVLRAWRREIDNNKRLTIREALWIARLYPVFREPQAIWAAKFPTFKEDALPGGTLLRDEILEALIEGAKSYALSEKAIKLTGEDPDKREDWYRFFSTTKLSLILQLSEEAIAKVSKNNEGGKP